MWKSYKSGRKYGCECGSDKNNLMAVISPQVAVVFARSGSEGLQGSGNTAKSALRRLAGQDGWLGRPLLRWQLVPLMRVMYSIY